MSFIRTNFPLAEFHQKTVLSSVGYIVKKVRLFSRHRIEEDGETDHNELQDSIQDVMVDTLEAARSRRQVQNTLAIRIRGGTAEYPCTLTTSIKYRASTSKIIFAKRNSMCGLCISLPGILWRSYMLLQTRRNLLVLVS
jgi:hypothetical protein